MRLQCSRSVAAIAAIAASTAVLLAVRPSPSRAEPTTIIFPLRIHQVAGRHIEQDQWLDAQVDRANALFAAAGVRFAIQQRIVLDDEHATIDTHEELDALETLLHPLQLDVFLALAIVLDAPDRTILGVCHQERLGPHLVAIVIGEDPDVLAHELGHYFGLGHVDAGDNVMARYAGGSTTRTLDARQSETLAATAYTLAMAHTPAALSGL